MHLSSLRKEQEKFQITNKEVAKQLEKARFFLQKGWCQGSYAKDSMGNSVPEHAPEACQWCLQGAINATSQAESIGGVYLVKEDARVSFTRRLARHELERQSGDYVIVFNDQRAQTSQDVIEILDRCVQELKSNSQEVYRPMSDREFAEWALPRLREIGLPESEVGDQICYYLELQVEPDWLANLVSQGYHPSCGDLQPRKEEENTK